MNSSEWASTQLSVVTDIPQDVGYSNETTTKLCVTGTLGLVCVAKFAAKKNSYRPTATAERKTTETAIKRQAKSFCKC